MEQIEAKTILSGYRENNPWFGHHYNMNLYKGCNHGCIYCDSRSDCYGVEEFDRVRAKENALTLVASELRSKRKKGVVGTGAMSDPYNPFEKEAKLTKGAVQLIDQYRFGISIATKSDLILRDLEQLQKIAKHSPVLTKITVTSASDDICKKVEPNVASSSMRFQAIRELSRGGIFTGILLMPVLPFIEDSEENIIEIIELAREHGAKFIYPAFGVTLRQNQREWFYNKLDLSFPGIKEQYIAAFGNNYECRSPNAKKLWNIFRKKCEEFGILYKMDDIIEAYQKPYQIVQMSLFE